MEEILNLQRLSNRCPDEASSVDFLQTRGILHRDRQCVCGQAMNLKNLHGILKWRCSDWRCNKMRGIRPAKLPFFKVVRFIYGWAKELTSINWCQEELEMDHSTTVDWNNYMREVCAWWILERQGMVGGPGQTVEVDEAMFSRRKNHVGRMLPQQWVFGGICRETRECFLMAVPDRSEATLMGVIEQKIAPGSTIISDCWAGYNNVGADGRWQHLRVNHRYNFVDPETGAHTQIVERLWRSIRVRNKKQSGTHRSMLDSYLCEFLWRHDVKRRNVDPFNEILSHIAVYSPPQ